MRIDVNNILSCLKALFHIVEGKIVDFNNKKDFRKFVLETRDLIDVKKRLEWDEIIFDKLINSTFYKECKTIFTFVSFKSEVNTHRFIEHAIRGSKIIGVPKIKNKQTGIEVFKINSLKDLEVGYFNTLEPRSECPKVNNEDIDFIVMPGLAFDREGGRIGYGGGFYDRFLMNLNKKVDKIAIAYQFQIFDDVPTNEMDVNVDGIITEKEFIKI
jgi:5-formyltetrahydrofolate cyclo-ligase